VLLLDEPTRGIDVGARAEIEAFVREQAAGGMAVLYVASSLDELLRVAERVLVLRAGRSAGELAGAGLTEVALHARLAGGASHGG
jgi:ribose transport system ATP-binding protein